MWLWSLGACWFRVTILVLKGSEHEAFQGDLSHQDLGLGGVFG